MRSAPYPKENVVRHLPNILPQGKTVQTYYLRKRSRGYLSTEIAVSYLIQIVAKTRQNLQMDWLKVLYIFQIWLYVLKLERLVKSRKALNVRRWWVKPHLKSHIRDTVGGYQLIFIYFKLEDHEEFKRFIGMSVASFDELLNKVRRDLTRYGPRKPLSAELKLAIVLRYVNIYVVDNV